MVPFHSFATGSIGYAFQTDTCGASHGSSPIIIVMRKLDSWFGKRNDANTVVGPKTSTFQHLVDRGGFFYVVYTLVCNVYCCGLFGAYLENSVFWPNFHASGIQAALIELFNNQLALAEDDTDRRQTPLNILDPSVAAPRGLVALPILTSYPRMLLYSKLTAFDSVIPSLRTLTVQDVAFTMISQYCWVDFNRTWEMAHTALRQVRCRISDTDNAAVYLEAVLRNIDFPAWLGSYDALYSQTIAAALAESPEGIAWTDYMVGHTWAKVAAEAALWSQANLTRFELQWANEFQMGLMESIVLVNALGFHSSVTIKAITSQSRGTMWTSSNLYCSLENDFYALSGTNESLVRQSNMFFELSDPTAIEVYTAPFPLNRLNQVLHDQLGPLGSIDLKWISPPPALLRVVDQFRVSVTLQLRTDAAFAASFATLPALALHPTPPLWTDPTLVFYGGNPMCSNGAPRPFIQLSFGFEDSCSSQGQYTVVSTAASILFARSLVNRSVVQSMCDVCTPAEQHVCAQLVQSTEQLVRRFPSRLNATAVTRDVGALEIELFQLVGDDDSDGAITVQTHRLIDSNSPAWNVFGWMSVYEWALGEREAVAFQGDLQTLHLLSFNQALTAGAAVASDVSRTLGTGLLAAAVFVSAMLGFVGTLIGLMWLQSADRQGRNLFLFNRVAGTIWVGRPLLLVRGVTAIFCLATAPVRLHSASLIWLENAPRSSVVTCLLAGESLWAAYVMNDMLYPVTQATTRQYAQVSCAIIWLATVFVDMWFPPSIAASIGRDCSMHRMGLQIYCTSGTVQIGHLSRVVLLLGMQAIVVVVVAIGAWGVATPPTSTKRIPSLMWPGAAIAFLAEAPAPPGVMAMDEFGSVLCGVVVYKRDQALCVLDFTLWLLLDAHACNANVQGQVVYVSDVLTKYKFSRTSTVDGAVGPWSRHSTVVVCPVHHTTPTDMASLPTLPSSTAATTSNDARREKTLWRQLAATCRSNGRLVDTLWLCAGFFSIVSSLVGNFLYMFVTTSRSMANDFFWADFNSTGTHAFLANVYNRYLLSGEPTLLSVEAFRDIPTDYSSAAATIQFPNGLGRNFLFDPSIPLESTIAHLRQLDPCMLPWVFTQYCWVDFDRTWDMANSQARQARCEAAQTFNGAVYLDAMLRNVNNWPAWNRCWGTSFEVGLARPLRQSNDGLAWLASVQRGILTTVPIEALYWMHRNITRFVLQWQNYKGLGIANVLQIQNALGVQHPLTINKVNAMYRLEHENSRKMYWALAGDFWAIASNATRVAGLSLIRSDRAFAFANVSAADLLVENLTVALPLTPGFASFEASVGPFGSVDMVYVVPPRPARQFFQQAIATLTSLLYANASARAAFAALPPKNYITPFPSDWLDGAIASLGGNMLCGSDVAAASITSVDSSVFNRAFSVANVCHTYFSEYITPDQYLVFFALLGTHLNTAIGPDDVAAYCEWDAGCEDNCVDIHTAWLDFLTTTAAATTAPLAPLAIETQTDVAALNLHVMQYIMNDTTPQLYRRQVVDPTSPTWTFFGWCYVYDWVAGNRDVVSFQGDGMSLSIVSGYSGPLHLNPDPAEIPLDFSFLLQVSITYVTVTCLALGVWIAVYTVVDRGHVAGANLMRMHRLVGLIWTGRLFIFVRSVSAMLLLSTLQATLAVHGTVTGLETPRLASFNVALASLEFQWFVYLLNDGLSGVTQLHTNAYAGKSTWLTSLIVFVWMQVRPRAIVATMARQCTAVDMDSALVCDSGVLEIGSLTLVTTSMAICAACTVVCYVVERYIRCTAKAVDVLSLLLSSQAKYILTFDDWSHHGTIFLDKATALMAGIVTLERHGTLYLLDIKKWRVVSFERPPLPPSTPARFRHAIPIFE
ncbi:Aste57867_21480 [Aphanomyces stellatus]|uniref:Aste57867_21480 protein n=1 Tax=Aphanomyces stellatus TaxID=120398 RepID=A0A485LIB6_9STRA|nr:hypothetical protein As57867_021411 [Aphanomyces stellatus]VFT98150.1 Aste57867_21480 [Aphanomyces stellatus]